METQSQSVQIDDGAAETAPSRRAQNAADKRRAILDGARGVFMGEGFGGASMDAIAESAGVSKMTLYRYFDSKEALFAGVIADLCEGIVAVDPGAALEDLPPEEALTRFARRLMATVYAPETLALHRVVLAEGMRFPELGRLFYDSGPGRNIAALADYLASHKDDPRLAISDPQKAAEQFSELVRGYTHLRLLLGIEAPPDAAAREALIAEAVARFIGQGGRRG